MSRTYKHEEFDFPPWVPGVFGLLALITGLTVIVGSDEAAGSNFAASVVFAGLVLLPYVLEGISTLIKTVRVALPKVLFPVPVLAGMAVLMANSRELDFAPFVLVMLCAQMAAESEAKPLFGIVVTIAACTEMVLGEAFGPHDDSFIWVIGIAFGWFGGYSVETLAKQTFELKRANAELAETSAAQERQRIAREVHDVIAHSLSVTMLHTSAARMALEKGRTDDALEALREAEKQGRNSLSEVRRTVGLLGPDESTTAAPMPSIADLPRLAADFRTAGLDITMKVDSDPQVPAAVGLNVYRIVQEALTNAVKHSPGAPVDVQVKICDEGMHVRVHNPSVNGADPNTSGKGLGLRGMSERAALLGGKLDTDASDGWTITVTAPRPA